jgi:hypothetical protein
VKTKKLAFYLLAGILGGCIPVMSLHPLYTKEKKELVFENKLLGTWVDDSNNIWDFKQADANEKAYKFIFTDKEGKKGSFLAHLVNLGKRLFLDVFPNQMPWDEKDPNKTLWPYNTLFLMPIHTFIKVNAIESQLKLQLTDDDELKKLLKDDPNAIENILIEDRLLLTASTTELQKFVLKHADDSRLFTEESVLTRKKTKEPQVFVKPETNEPNNVDPNQS